MTTYIFDYLTEALKSIKEMTKTDIFIIMLAIGIIIAFITTVYNFNKSNK